MIFVSFDVMAAEVAGVYFAEAALLAWAGAASEALNNKQQSIAVIDKFSVRLLVSSLLFSSLPTGEQGGSPCWSC